MTYMNLREVLEDAMNKDLIDLQALIMFLVMEKEVLTLEDDVSELDLYFLERHHKRMNAELHAYKRKMSMQEKPCAWRVYTDNETLYIYAKNELQARSYAITLKCMPKGIEYADGSELMMPDDKPIELRKFYENMNAPAFIGWNDTEQKYRKWERLK